MTWDVKSIVKPKNKQSVKTFLAKHKIPVMEHPHTCQIWHLVIFFFCFPRWSPYWKELVWVHRSGKGKSDATLEQCLRKWTAALLPWVEDLHRAVQGSWWGVHWRGKHLQCVICLIKRVWSSVQLFYSHAIYIMILFIWFHGITQTAFLTSQYVFHFWYGT